jgi:hypothetical protein
MKKTKTTKKELFSTYWLEDWFNDEQYLNEERTFLSEEMDIKPEEVNEDMIRASIEDNYEICLDEARRALSDLYLSCDKICVVADLGLWYGRASGYKIIDTDEILYSDCDYATWYVEDGDLKFKGSHHDGNNHYVYYGIKDIYEFEDDVEEHGLTDEVIKKHLVSIGDEVEKLCYL